MSQADKTNLLLPKELRLNGRRVLVTGAASGIGRATAICLAELGADLVLADRDSVAGVCAEVEALGSKAAALQGDLTDEAFLRTLIEHGPYFSFANIAGVFRGLESQSAEEAFDFVMHINLRAPMVLANALIDQMGEQGGGYIVMVGSSAGRAGGGSLGTPIEYATYATSKGGLHTLVRALSRRAAKKNVLVNGVAPGVVRTALLDSVSPSLNTDPNVSPLGRAADARELAWPIALLCSPAASFMAGAIVDVNGGYFVG